MVMILQLNKPIPKKHLAQLSTRSQIQPLTATRTSLVTTLENYDEPAT